MAAARTDNLSSMWIVLTIGSLGIGGIVVPASIMSTIICPDVRIPPEIPLHNPNENTNTRYF